LGLTLAGSERQKGMMSFLATDVAVCAKSSFSVLHMRILHYPAESQFSDGYDRQDAFVVCVTQGAQCQQSCL